jgi:hypothetical protein
MLAHELGRFARKGEKGIQILVPILGHRRKRDAEQQEQEAKPMEVLDFWIDDHPLTTARVSADPVDECLGGVDISALSRQPRTIELRWPARSGKPNLEHPESCFGK